MYNMLVAIIGFTQQKEKKGKERKGEKRERENDRAKAPHFPSLINY